MTMYKITPKDTCKKHLLRVFYTHADGYVPTNYKKRPSTTVPIGRLGRVLDVMTNAHKINRRSLVFRGPTND